MRAQFKGDENDEGTKQMGIVRNGVYNITLQRTNWFSTKILRIPIIAQISVGGHRHAVPYGSMEAFEANWDVK